jgi:hypothetical protein
LFYVFNNLSSNLVFEGLGLEQLWRPPWLLIKLTMAGRKGTKSMSEMAEASKATAVAAIADVSNTATAVL